ncbi:hypothetical protein AVEN_94733-1 [Araneus ventricosus]|uniref:Integrase catalytic domain-containing protein n=1 Tax=Araneus ventricosus TaxID=182803 RepID=A0A4Y2CLZ0_ARAVE|nr:hypothetical protein AVEN_94733-1 [Araneus ventricosus]
MPAARMEQLPPFSIVGIDFGGPLYRNNSDNKNYIVLFICGVTRAMHLEFFDNLTNETFLLALQRFITRRVRFIVEKATWGGVFHERLIRSVKLALRKTLGKTTVSREELETPLIEIEGVLNFRPLTYVFSEFQEPVPLTPAHMLLRRRVNSCQAYY